MQDILKSIKAFLYDRAASPLLGAFIVAWLVWNYRIVFLLTDDNTLIAEKLSFLDSYFGDDHLFQLLGYPFHVIGGGHLIHGLVMPSVLAWVYLYLYPKFAIPVYKHSLAKQKELRSAKQEAENERLLTVEESRNIQKEIEQLRYKADEEAASYRSRIVSLTETINKLESQLNVTKIDNYSNDLSDEITLDNLLNRKLKEKIETKDLGQFEVKDLLGDEWEKISESKRNKYAKLLKQIVDRGDFPNISLIGNGLRNQFIYEMKPPSDLNAKMRYQNRIIAKFPLERFVKNTFDSVEKHIDSLKNIANYLFENSISEDGFDLILEMVMSNGSLNKKHLEGVSFYNLLSPIEFDHLVSNLVKKGYISEAEFGERIILTEKGKDLVVSSGLAALVKKLKKR